jgi:HEAT repeat protein
MDQDTRIRQAMAALDGRDVEARAEAIEMLGDRRHRPAVPRLMELVEEVDPGTRFLIVRALGMIGDPAAVTVLLKAMRGDDIWTRSAATGALIRFGTVSVDGLIVALGDKDKAVRRAAAKAIGKIGSSDHDGDAIRGLSVALLDVDAGVRRFAAEALGRLEADSMVDELSEVLRDHNPKVRIAAFKALANIDTPEAQDAVRAWAKS